MKCDRDGLGIGTKTGSELGVKLGVEFFQWVPFPILEFDGAGGILFKVSIRTSSRLHRPFKKPCVSYDAYNVVSFTILMAYRIFPLHLS